MPGPVWAPCDSGISVIFWVAGTVPAVIVGGIQ